MPQISVLFVDDDAFHMVGIFHMMERADIKVTYVYDALMAEDLLKNNHYDVLITDLMMPDMSGIELIERLRAGSYGPELQNIPTVLWTVGLTEGEGTRAHKLGVEVVHKGLRLRDFIRTVKRIAAPKQG